MAEVWRSAIGRFRRKLFLGSDLMLKYRMAEPKWQAVFDVESRISVADLPRRIWRDDGSVADEPRRVTAKQDEEIQVDITSAPSMNTRTLLFQTYTKSQVVA